MRGAELFVGVDPTQHLFEFLDTLGGGETALGADDHPRPLAVVAGRFVDLGLLAVAIDQLRAATKAKDADLAVAAGTGDDGMVAASLDPDRADPVALAALDMEGADAIAL